MMRVIRSLQRACWLCLLVLVEAAVAQDALRVVGDENYPPYLFRDSDGNVQGYLVDYWRLWEEKTGIPVELTATRWAEAQQMLLRGEADVIDMIYRTPAREALYGYSEPYIDLPVSIFNHVSISGISGPQTLKGLLVGVQRGDACIEQLAMHGITDLAYYDNYSTLIHAAQQLEVKIICLDDAPASFYLYRFSSADEFRKSFTLYTGQFHRAVRKGEAALLAQVERGSRLISAEENEALRRKWLGTPLAGQAAQWLEYLRWLVPITLGTWLVLLVWLWTTRLAVRRKTAELAAKRARLQESEERYRRLFEETEQRVLDRTAELASTSAELAASRETLQTIFDTVSTGILMTHNRVIVACNRRCEEMLGYEHEALIGDSNRILYANPEDWQRVGQQAYALFGSGQAFTCEVEARRRDGSTVWVRLSSRAVDPANLEFGIVSSLEDITAERAARAAIEQARLSAEDAARTKAEFLANMSHEIRTPMNSVLGMTHLALQAEPPERVRDYLQKIQAAGHLLLGVINDILDFSKIEADKLVLESTDVELEKLLTEVADLFVARASAKGLEMILDIAPDVPATLLGDPLRLTQVLVNMTSNALKFTEQGQVILRVERQMLADEVPGLRFSVIDSGIGISAEDRARLFESFRQVDSSITRRFGGTGLGLAICKRLVELMGGMIGVDSTPGQGSCFWFSVPLHAGSEVVRDYPLQADLRGLNTLVVDDNPHAASVIALLLQGMGFKATQASSGEQALQVIADADALGAPFDVIFLDWHMPGMDGLAVAEALSRQPLSRLPLVLMVTADDREAVRERATRLGIGEVLVKPVSPSGLFNALLQHFGLAQQRAAQRGLEAPAANDLKGAWALLVEDNAFNQEVAREFLQAFGMQVDLAENGAIALDKVRQHPYDVVLMDMQMPVMDGLTATRQLRAMPEGRELPILAMTANALPADRARCLQAGMNDHIAKPIDPRVLLASLQRWVRLSPEAADRHPTAEAAEVAAPDTLSAKREALEDEACVSALPPIEGLDMQVGLQRALGREGFYQHLLRRFCRGQRDCAAQLREALVRGARDEAERLAHSLKSVAAQIGAEGISAQAATLEQAIRAGQEDAALMPLIEPLAQALEALIRQLDAQLPEVESEVEEASINMGEWPAVRQQLIALLAFDDGDSKHVFARHQALVRAGLGSEFAAFAQALNGFDFPQALQILRAHPVSGEERRDA
ncbi:response regulator [Pseudomonas sp. NW5]|uniref:response regulator n=1 Tax=Pseudomonas sp. NW5 TaxID=2934934 RepID=UPI002020D561|nr:response regulator [Pseudomonas sp. NW5]MCL7463376.1 response regulator [Pseudomonas sp. NW5]